MPDNPDFVPSIFAYIKANESGSAHKKQRFERIEKRRRGKPTALTFTAMHVDEEVSVNESAMDVSGIESMAEEEGMRLGSLVEVFCKPFSIIISRV